MSFLEQNKPNPVIKPLIIVVAVLLVVGGIYSLGGKNNIGKAQKAVNSNAKIETAADVQKVVAQWIADNPKAIIESVSNMQRQAAQQQNKDAQKNIVKRKSQLESADSPSVSPAGYDVTIVEFFDYSCGYCKKVQSTVKALIAQDKKVRIVFKEFPILGQASVEMSQIATAVHLLDEGSYLKFHDALMESQARGKDAAIAVAKKVGIDVVALKEVLSSREAEISQILQQNSELGRSIGINGTPAFVIGEELLPGAVDLGTLQSKIEALRK